MDSPQQYEEMNKKEGILRKVITKSRTLFEKIKFFFLNRQTPSQSFGPLEVRLSLLSRIFDEPFPEALSDRIELYSMIGYSVLIKEQSEEIPEGYIGILSCWNGEILEYRQYLKLQVEYVEKKIIVFQRI